MNEHDDIIKILETKFDQLDKFYDLMDGRIYQIETGISTLHKDIEKIFNKVDKLGENSIGASKEIEFLKEKFDKSEIIIKNEIDSIWEKGIREEQKNVKSSCKEMREELLETVVSKIDRRVLKEQVLLYGAVIAALVSFIRSLI